MEHEIKIKKGFECDFCGETRRCAILEPVEFVYERTLFYVCLTCAKEMVTAFRQGGKRK